MRTTSYRSFSVFIFIAILSSVISFTPLKASNIITSLDFQISPARQTAKIGDYILFNMAVIDATTTYNNVLVSSVTDTSMVVYSPSFPAVLPAGGIYIYDGTHTWHATGVYGAVTQSVTLDNTAGNLIAGQAISSYTTMQYAGFNAAEGALSPGGIATVDIGSTVGISLYDDGALSHNDVAASDGIYNGQFLVRESYQFNIQNGNIVGRFVKSGAQASNAPFIAPSKIQIDGIRPKISLVNASPNPYNPNTELEQFYYYLSESSAVTLTVYDAVMTPVKTLTASGNYGYNQPILWDGLNDNGDIQTDGDYTYQFDMTDSVGNTGVTFIGGLKLTTIELTTSLFSVDSQYIHTSQSQVMVTIQMHAELKNATMPHLLNLGFPVSAADPTHDYQGYPYLYLDLRMYDSTGMLTDPVIRDNATMADTDPMYINLSNILFNPRFADAKAINGFVYDPVPADPCIIINGHQYSNADDVPDNDWDNVFLNPFTDNGGGKFTVNPSYRYFSDKITAGTYIVAFKGVLVGKSIVPTNDKTLSSTIDCVDAMGNTTPKAYTYNKYHAMPSYFYDPSVGYVGDSRGYGLASEDNTVTFIVEQDPTVPVPDTVPPVIVNLSAVPSDTKTVLPGEISPTNYIQIQIRDDGVGAGPVNNSNIVLLDPNGNPVLGHVAWNGGIAGTKTWSVYYIPDAAITIGGIYHYIVTPVDAAGNRGAAVTYSFTVKDTAMPVIQNVIVYPSSGTNKELSKSITTQVVFPVYKIEVTINSGGTSLVDWTSSGIKVSGSSGVITAGSVSHTAGTNTIDFIPSSVISDGSYVVSIVSVSENGASGIATYNFYVTTAGITYVDLLGNTSNDGSTYLVISPRSVFNTTTGFGVTDGLSNVISLVDLKKIVVANDSTPPDPPSGYKIINAVDFSVMGDSYPMGLNFDSDVSDLRMHFTDVQLLMLTSSLLTPADLTLWVYQSSWTKISTAGSIINNGSDHYIDIPIAFIPAGNKYALMYQPPVIPPAAYKFDNTKAFNPANGPAKIYYSASIADIASMKVYIYNISGTIIRTLDKTDPAEYPLFDNPYTDPTNASIKKYYIKWDGKNDKGSDAKNGLYIFKYKITRTSGAVESKSRMIAVVR